MTHLFVKIDKLGSENKMNMNKFEVPKIRHFDNNVEKVLRCFNLLDTKVMNHVIGITKEERILCRLQYIESICFDNAQQEYNEAIEHARAQVLLDYSYEILRSNNRNDLDISSFELDNEEFDKLNREPESFMVWMKKAIALIHDNEVDILGFGSKTETRYMKWKNYEMHFLNHLNVVIFGKKYFRAIEDQMEYMQYGMTKPFGAKVAQCFRSCLLYTSPSPRDRG